MYIISHEVAGYHQCRALYRRSFLANPSLRSLHQTAEDTRRGVMIYSSKGADEMHAKAWWYAKPAVWIKKAVSKWYDFFGRNETFAKGETRFGLHSKHRRLESDLKGKRHLIAMRQVSLDGRNDRVTPLRFVIPSVCEPAFAVQNSFKVPYQSKKKKTTARAVFFFFCE